MSAVFLAQEANRMLYYDASGHGRFVYQADFWAVPSPDGKRLAVVYHASESAASQVWR